MKLNDIQTIKTFIPSIILPMAKSELQCALEYVSRNGLKVLFMLLLENIDDDKYLNTHMLTCYGLTEESFKKGLANLEKNGYIQRKPDNNFYFTPNWAIYDEYKKDVD